LVLHGQVLIQLLKVTVAGKKIPANKINYLRFNSIIQLSYKLVKSV